MIRSMKEHEIYMEEIMNKSKGVDLNELRDYHWAQIGFLQKERLAHLLVTLAFTFLMIIAFVVTYFLPVLLMFILDLLLVALEVAYIIHYYRLENMVQRWYLLYSKISGMMREEE